MTDRAILVADPVFQLNAFLWALEDIPSGVGEIHPVLRSAGYYLSSVGRGLVVPVNETVLEALAQVIGSRDRQSSHPDLWLKHQGHEAQPIIELKAQGFSTESKQKVSQASKILVSSADLEASAGGGGTQPGHVIYATVNDDAEALLRTLRAIAARLTQAGATSAPVATIGLNWDGQAVTLGSPDPVSLPAPMAEALATPVALLEVTTPENSVQPLYLVPWVPGLDDSQDPELRSDGLYQLTARLLSEAISRIGQAKMPAEVTLSGPDILASATYGIFAKWRDADRHLFGRAAAQLVERALRPTKLARLQGDRVEIDLPTEEAQAQAIERLERADPADPSKSIETAIAEPPTLFDTDF